MYRWKAEEQGENVAPRLAKKFILLDPFCDVRKKDSSVRETEKTLKRTFTFTFCYSVRLKLIMSTVVN